MVDRRVGKAEEGLLRHGLLRHGLLQRVLFKQIRREAVGVVAADGAEDQIDLRVAEGLQQVLRPPLRVPAQGVQPVAGMRQELDPQAVGLQARKAERCLVLHKRLTQEPSRQADDADGPDHTASLRFFFYVYGIGLTAGLQDLFCPDKETSWQIAVLAPAAEICYTMGNSGCHGR